MQGAAAALEREFLTWCLQQPGVPRHKLATQCPDFLVISPPKTGSTWLADNLLGAALFLANERDDELAREGLREADEEGPGSRRGQLPSCLIGAQERVEPAAMRARQPRGRE